MVNDFADKTILTAKVLARQCHRAVNGRPTHLLRWSWQQKFWPQSAVGQGNKVGQGIEEVGQVGKVHSEQLIALALA